MSDPTDAGTKKRSRALVALSHRLGQLTADQKKEWGLRIGLRMLVVVCVCVGALYLVRHWSHADETGHVLRHVTLVGVGLAARWWWLGSVNVLFALLWLLSFREETRHMTRTGKPKVRGQILLSVNRQLGHIEAIFAWTTFVVVTWPRLDVQAPLLAFTLLAMPSLIDLGVALIWPGTIDQPGDRMWLRRPALYVMTLSGLVALAVIASPLTFDLVMLDATIIVAGLLRSVTWFLWFRWVWKERRPAGLKPEEGGAWRANLEERKRFRNATSKAAPGWDRFILALAAGGALFVPLSQLSTTGTRASDRVLLARNTLWCNCGGDPKQTLSRRDASLFIVADSQFHELAGTRDGTHVDLIDSLVPVAVRPVELDLLSGVTLSHFADVYRYERARFQRLSGGQNMLWAHLGDVADLGCRTELDRLEPYMDRFGRGNLAALVPGNHDSAFTGNFTWHPDWTSDEACHPHKGVGGPSVKAAPDGTNDHFLKLSRGYWANPDAAANSATGPSPFLARVTPLGRSQGKTVLGAFIDTSNYTHLSLGINGVQGDVSSDQIEWIRSRLAGDASSWIVLFMHHPLEELSVGAQDRVRMLVSELGSRVLALVSAHTHLAGQREHCVNGSSVPEFVVGSVIDPPQEAAILDIGPGADGGVERPAVRLTTIPAVVRADQACGDDPDPSRAGQNDSPRIEASVCATAYKAVKDNCSDLFGASPDAVLVGSDCPQYVGKWWPSLEPSPDLPSPTPSTVKCMQQDRAWRLLTCLVRQFPGAGSISLPRKTPLDDDELYDWIERIDRQGKGSMSAHRELVCLSWAASILQGNKSRGWGLPQAMDFASERLVTFGAQRMFSAATEPTCPQSVASAGRPAPVSLYAGGPERR